MRYYGLSLMDSPFFVVTFSSIKERNGGMATEKLERESIRVLLWYINKDQYDRISKECLDGKSYSEYIRRAIDYGINNELHKTFQQDKNVNRPLYKSQFSVTQKQYDWFLKSFPQRKKAQGLRYILENYLNSQKEEI